MTKRAEGKSREKKILLRSLGRAPEPLNSHILSVHDAAHTSGVDHTDPPVIDGARYKILRCDISLIDPSHSGPHTPAPHAAVSQTTVPQNATHHDAGSKGGAVAKALDAADDL